MQQTNSEGKLFKQLTTNYMGHRQHGKPGGDVWLAALPPEMR